ncbi:MAG: hypothetical protein WBP03_05845 [Candidatus Saccharimonadales bacterium]
MKFPEADSAIGHSFGTTVTEPSVNAQLAALMVVYANGRPMIADRTLVNALPNGDELVAHIVEGDVTNIKAQGVGTWGTLVEAHQYMEENDLHSPIMIAQAYHIDRVVKQAAKLGIRSIVPEDLPEDFDRTSDQIWTRSAALWIPFNALGSLLLKKRGQL